MSNLLKLNYTCSNWKGRRRKQSNSIRGGPFSITLLFNESTSWREREMGAINLPALSCLNSLVP